MKEETKNFKVSSVVSRMKDSAMKLRSEVAKLEVANLTEASFGGQYVGAASEFITTYVTDIAMATAGA
jgi:hypothetical protein